MTRQRIQHSRNSYAFRWDFPWRREVQAEAGLSWAEIACRRGPPSHSTAVAQHEVLLSGENTMVLLKLHPLPTG